MDNQKQLQVEQLMDIIMDSTIAQHPTAVFTCHYKPWVDECLYCIKQIPTNKYLIYSSLLEAAAAYNKLTRG